MGTKLHEVTIKLNVEKSHSFKDLLKELEEINKRYKSAWLGNGARLCKGRTAHVPIIDGHIPTWHGDDSGEVVSPLLHKGECPALVMIDELEKVKAIPIFSKDANVLVFRATKPMERAVMDHMEKEYSNKIGIKCVVLDCKAELVAVQNG